MIALPMKCEIEIPETKATAPANTLAGSLVLLSNFIVRTASIDPMMDGKNFEIIFDPIAIKDVGSDIKSSKLVQLFYEFFVDT